MQCPNGKVRLTAPNAPIDKASANQPPPKSSHPLEFA